MGVAVNMGDKLGISRYQLSTICFEKYVNRTVVDIYYGSYQFPMFIVQAKSNKLVPRKYPFLLIGEAPGKEDFIACEFTRLVGSIDITELHQCDTVAAETIRLHKKGHEDTIGVNNKVISIDPVEDIIIEKEAYFSLYAMRLSQAPYPENIFSLNHLSG